MRSKLLVNLVFAVLVSTFAFAFIAGAQETTDARARTTEADTQRSKQPLVFAEGERTARAQADTEPSGPLAGTTVGTISTDKDDKVEIIKILRPDCTAKEGASLVIEDDDGTQGDLIDNDNIRITEVSKGLKVTSNLAASGADIEATNVRGGDEVLDNGGLMIVTSTNIQCKGGTPTPTSTPTPEPQDKDKGPLAGGTAIGKDVLVPGDVIRVLPDGTEVVGIDQIIIKTENCELTAQGDDLTITLSDQGVPFRLRDGQNVDITIRPDGTIVANGRKTLGDDFPPGERDNPTRIIVPIPVDPENDEFSSEPNNRFPIISSTGIDGEGCRVVDGGDGGDADDNGSMDNSDTDSRDDVIPSTTSDQPLPNTGGVPLYGVIGSGFVLAGAAVMLLSISPFRLVSTSARRRAE